MFSIFNDNVMCIKHNLSKVFSYKINRNEELERSNINNFNYQIYLNKKELTKIELRLSKCEMFSNREEKLKEANDSSTVLTQLTMNLRHSLVYALSWKKAQNIWALLALANKIAVTFRN